MFIPIDWYESMRKNVPPKIEREIPKEYRTEIEALEQCCQHRIHCFVYDVVGLLQVKHERERESI